MSSNIGNVSGNSLHSPLSEKIPAKIVDPLNQAIQQHAAKTLPILKTPIQAPIGKRPPARFSSSQSKKTHNTQNQTKTDQVKKAKKPAFKPVVKQPDKKNNKKKPIVQSKEPNKGILYQFFTYIFTSIGYLILRMLGRK